MYRFVDAIFDFLGITRYPFFDIDDDGDVVPRNSSAADLRLSMLSDYNITTISMALVIPSRIDPDMNDAVTSQCSSALLVGMVAGQLAGVLLGGFLGRHFAMTVVMFYKFWDQSCVPWQLTGTCRVSVSRSVV